MTLYFIWQCTVEKKKVLKKLLKLVNERFSDSPMMEATVFWSNIYKNTVLHEAAATGNLGAVKLLLDDCKDDGKRHELLVRTNEYEETPLFTAAAYGSTKVLKYLAEQRGQCEGRKLKQEHRQRNEIQGESILHVAIQGENFGTALELLKLDPSLADLKDNKGMTSLQLLATRRSAFKSGSNMGIWKRILYRCIPVGNVIHDDYDVIEDEDDDDDGHAGGHSSDLESGLCKCKKRRSCILNLQKDLIRRVIFREWPTIKKVWEEKRKHKYAVQLADKLIENDNSWAQSEKQISAPVKQSQAEVENKQTARVDSQRKQAGGVDSQPNLAGGVHSQPNLAGGVDSQPKQAGGVHSQPKEEGGVDSLPKQAGGGSSQPKQTGGEDSQPKQAGASSQPNQAGGEDSQPNQAGGKDSRLNQTEGEDSQAEQGGQEGSQPKQPGGENSQRGRDDSETRAEIPLFLATKSGIVEIVKMILDKHPQAVEHVSHLKQNILHVAIKYRRKEVFDRVKKFRIPMKRLVRGIDSNGYTILHHAADVEPTTEQALTGPAYELQEELKWYKRVEKITPTFFATYNVNVKNEKEQKKTETNVMEKLDRQMTARELFEKKHKDQLTNAQTWTKDTAQSCSAVAVLLATVVFAAVFTVPGGSNDEGLPVFLNSPFFKFFTVMDIVSLASSLTSVVMFLSILTSPSRYKDFKHSLPRRLTFGFALLFVSVVTTMLAFVATVLLIIRLEPRRWTSTLVYTAAFLPVSILALTQFPMLVSFKKTLRSAFNLLKHVLPLKLFSKLFRPPFPKKDKKKNNKMQ